MKVFKITLLTLIGLMGAGLMLFVWYAHKPVPEKIVYGMSFNTLYARELGLDWQETYDAILDELKVRHLRLAAHWPMIEPRNDVFNFTELDYQVRRAEETHTDIIMAVGRRLPRWPECHVPEWAKDLSPEEQQEEILEYVAAVVNRYKKSPAITYWQIENEPYLSVFAPEYCGTFDEAFFEREVAYFRSLDSTRPFLITDSGNLGLWSGPYKHGDVFGTSVYVYFWNPELGQFKTILPPWFYWLKEGFVKLRYGEKETMLIELSAEPWLVAPVTDVDINTQFSRMNLDKFNEILRYAEGTRFTKQYLWGAEWWYWLRQHGHSEMWDRGVTLFKQ